MKLVQSYDEKQLNPNNPHHFSPLPCDSLINLRQTQRTSLIPVAKQSFFLIKWNSTGQAARSNSSSSRDYFIVKDKFRLPIFAVIEISSYLCRQHYYYILI